MSFRNSSLHWRRYLGHKFRQVLPLLHRSDRMPERKRFICPSAPFQRRLLRLRLINVLYSVNKLFLFYFIVRPPKPFQLLPPPPCHRFIERVMPYFWHLRPGRQNRYVSNKLYSRFRLNILCMSRMSHKKLNFISSLIVLKKD